MKKVISMFLAMLMLFSVLPSNAYAKNDFNMTELYNNKETVNDLYVDKLNKQLYINGKAISEEQFVEMVIETGIVLSNTDSNMTTYSYAADLAPYLGWTIFVPGLGEIVLAATGIFVGGVLIYEVGSWAWNKVVDFISNDNNLTAEKYIGKYCKGSIMREFPSEYLGKTVKEIEKEAKKGNTKAKKALKLLKDGRFRK